MLAAFDCRFRIQDVPERGKGPHVNPLCGLQDAPDAAIPAATSALRGLPARASVRAPPARPARRPGGRAACALRFRRPPALLAADPLAGVQRTSPELDRFTAPREPDLRRQHGRHPRARRAHLAADGASRGRADARPRDLGHARGHDLRGRRSRLRRAPQRLVGDVGLPQPARAHSRGAPGLYRRVDEPRHAARGRLPVVRGALPVERPPDAGLALGESLPLGLPRRRRGLRVGRRRGPEAPLGREPRPRARRSSVRDAQGGRPAAAPARPARGRPRRGARPAASRRPRTTHHR